MATRLSLRPYEDADRDAFVALFSDAEVMAHVGGAMAPAEAARLFDDMRAGRRGRVLASWMAVDAGGAPVGHGALLRGEGGAVELGFVLRRERWGQGLATDLARMLVAEALAAYPGARVVATVDTDHPASRRVLEKAGLVLAGEGRDEDGTYYTYELDGAGDLPDARDGLTRLERVILVELARLEAERGGGMVPTAMLYGRVVEQVDVSVAEFQRVLGRLVGKR